MLQKTNGKSSFGYSRPRLTRWIWRPILTGAIFLFFTGCLTTSTLSRRAGATQTGESENNSLARENQELKAKVDDLNIRVQRLAQLVNDQQVKIDFIADKLRTLESQKGEAFFPESSGGKVDPQKQSPKTDGTIRKGETKADVPVEKSGAELNPDQLYDAAYNDYQTGKYQDSISKFKNFVSLSPSDPRAANAQYWIGECYYSLKDYRNAINSFQSVLQNYPLSGKIQDAILKKGFSYEILGQKELAEVDFQQVIDQFPSTAAAEIAKKKLTELKR
jgi:tol-pal system protein YbgF